jgi:hypothetical protein
MQFSARGLVFVADTPERGRRALQSTPRVCARRIAATIVPAPVSGPTLHETFTTMTALTKDEVLAQLQKEVRILLHLAGKIDRSQLDYRPTPKQRSTIELIRYLLIMGPSLIRAFKTGFDVERWQADAAAANAMSFDELLAAIEKQSAEYATLLGAWSEADFRGEIELFGRKASRGAFLMELVLGGCAAYRTQLFCYLKSCGRDELGTSNLWQGVDATVAV